MMLSASTPLRNPPSFALLALAVLASYLLALLATLALEQLGFGSVYVAGFVVTGVALGISWLLVHRGILVPIGTAHAVIDAGAPRLYAAGLHEHKIIGPLIGKVLKLTHTFRQTLRAVSEIIDKNSVALAATSHHADTLNRGMKALAGKGADIAASSHAIAATAAQVSASASRVAQSAQRAQDDSSSGQQALHETIAELRSMAARTQAASDSIAKLQDSSIKIEQIVKVIGEVATQINLLALNAAIEAARAGEHGRGFAVVADEVRKLAEKTSIATKEIYGNVAEIMDQTDQAVSTMSELLGDVQKGVGHVEQVGQRLDGILDFSSTLSAQMHEIVAAAEQSAHEVDSISGHLVQIQRELGEFGQQMDAISAQSQALSELGEGMHEQLADLDLDTVHGRMFKIAQAAAAEVQQAFEKAVAERQIGEAELFDRGYRPIANSAPQKYSSSFDRYTDQVLPAIQERIVNAHPELIYAICTDDKGYVPTHNYKFAKAPTGNYDVDLANSRSKRIFSDRTGSRCGAHTRKMLLQTYQRDTGEIMHDLSVPIYVGRRHWGGFRMGYRAS